jgi:hypothetical protein
MSNQSYKKEDFLNLTSEEIFTMFGGELLRGNVSNVIRELSSIGFTRGQISKMLNKRYQHVRNVLIEPLKKN